MKVTSGMTHPLVGTQARHLVSAAARAVPAPATANQPIASTRAPRRQHQLVTLTLVASAALLGCSSVTAPTWRTEPAYRVESAGADPVQGYLALARQYEGENRSAQALVAYRKAAQTAPGDADVQNTLGLALARQAQFGPAVLALRRAVALAPERAQLINNLGYALLLDGRHDEARAMFRLTLAVDPKHELALRNLAYADERQSAVGANAAAVMTTAVPPAHGPVVVQPVGPAIMPAEAAGSMAPAGLSRLPEAGESQAVTVVPQPMAAINEWTSTTTPQTGAGEKTSTAAAPARVSLEGVSIEIVNGNGISGAAARMRVWLQQQGIVSGRLANLPPYTSQSTQVQYRIGKAGQAQEVANRLPVEAQVSPAPEGSTRADLRIVIGHDARYSAGCAALSACAARERLAMASILP